MFESEAAAGPDLGFVAGRQFDGKAGGYQGGEMRLESDAFGGVEVHAGIFEGAVGVFGEHGVGVEASDFEAQVVIIAGCTDGVTRASVVARSFMRSICIAAGICFVSALRAQDVGINENQQVYRFTNPPEVRGMQEIATALRSVVRIPKLSIDSQAATISVSGTVGEVAAGQWLAHEFDRSAPGEAASFAMPGGGDDVLRTFYVRNTAGLQEMVTMLRTVGEVQLVYSYSALGAIVVRGTSAETESAAWLIAQLDMARGEGPRDYSGVSAGGSAMRVEYLPPGMTEESLKRLAAAVRTTGQVDRAFYLTAPPAIAMRGTSGAIELAQRVIDGWAQP